MIRYEPPHLGVITVLCVLLVFAEFLKTHPKGVLGRTSSSRFDHGVVFFCRLCRVNSKVRARCVRMKPPPPSLRRSWERVRTIDAHRTLFEGGHGRAVGSASGGRGRHGESGGSYPRHLGAFVRLFGCGRLTPPPPHSHIPLTTTHANPVHTAPKLHLDRPLLAAARTTSAPSRGVDGR